MPIISFPGYEEIKSYQNVGQQIKRLFHTLFSRGHLSSVDFIWGLARARVDQLEQNKKLQGPFEYKG